MKTILVNTYLSPGGGDTAYIFNLSDLLQSREDEVAFFAMVNGHNRPDPNADLFVSHIDFRELSRQRNPVAGLRVMSRAIYSVEARGKFEKLLCRFEPDTIHVQNIHAHITPSVVFEARKHGLPVVWTLHDHKLICPNTHFMIDATGEICEACGKRAYYHAILGRCKKGSVLASAMASLEAYAHWFMRVRDKVDAFISPSQFLRNKLIDRGFRPEKVHHLPMFVPDICFRRGNGRGEHFLFLGKIDPIKGVKAMTEACRSVPDASLIIAGNGDGEYAAQCRCEAPLNAAFVGFKTGRELHQLRDGARAIVLPSLCYENQPLAILEAFAASKPVIASNLGGMTELVKHGERGLLVPPGDAEALADAMRWMMSHPKEAREMGRNAYEYAREVHSAERHYDGLMAIYRKVGARGI